MHTLDQSNLLDMRHDVHQGLVPVAYDGSDENESHISSKTYGGNRIGANAMQISSTIG